MWVLPHKRSHMEPHQVRTRTLVRAAGGGPKAGDSRTHGRQCIPKVGTAACTQDRAASTPGASPPGVVAGQVEPAYLSRSQPEAGNTTYHKVPTADPAQNINTRKLRETEIIRNNSCCKNVRDRLTAKPNSKKIIRESHVVFVLELDRIL